MSMTDEFFYACHLRGPSKIYIGGPFLTFDEARHSANRALSRPYVGHVVVCRAGLFDRPYDRQEASQEPDANRAGRGGVE